MNNLFQQLDIQEEYFLDKNILEANYLKAQGQYHPDKSVGLSENEKILAIKKSADLNEAYKTLNDDVKRAEYMLGLKGYVVNKEKDNSFQPSQELLIKQMELREKADDPETDKRQFFKEIKADLEQVKKEFDELIRHSDFEWAGQKAIEMRYLDKLRTELKGKK